MKRLIASVILLGIGYGIGRFHGFTKQTASRFKDLHETYGHKLARFDAFSKQALGSNDPKVMFVIDKIAKIHLATGDFLLHGRPEQFMDIDMAIDKANEALDEYMKVQETV